MKLNSKPSWSTFDRFFRDLFQLVQRNEDLEHKKYLLLHCPEEFEKRYRQHCKRCKDYSLDKSKDIQSAVTSPEREIPCWARQITTSDWAGCHHHPPISVMIAGSSILCIFYLVAHVCSRALKVLAGGDVLATCPSYQYIFLQHTCSLMIIHVLWCKFKG